MGWCITRDLSARIKANATRGIESKNYEAVIKEYGDSVNSQLVVF